MPVLLQATLLVICSNVFMTFAWYAHLKDTSGFASDSMIDIHSR